MRIRLLRTFYKSKVNAKQLTLLFLFFLCSFYKLQAACDSTNSGIVTFNFVTDFGGNGNGVNNNFEAFQAAANCIMARGGHCKLYIPTGIFLVDPPDSIPPPKYALAINTCTNVTIYGVYDSTFIQYSDSIIFGYFDDVSGMALNKNIGGVAHGPGNLFYFGQNCDSITIKYIHANGNNKNSILGGVENVAHPNSRQITSSGIVLWSNCSHVIIDSCTFKQFCLDGLQLHAIANAIPSNIKVSNSHFDLNGRQGMSVSGVDSLTILNCSFDSTSQNGFRNTPSAGIDFEPDDSLPIPLIKNVHFINCQAIANFGSSMTIIPNVGNYAEDLLFSHCNFYDYDTNTVDSYNCTVFADSKSTRFDTCKFIGRVEAGYQAQTSVDRMIFKGCDFSDQADGSGNYKPTRHLFTTENKHTNFLQFNECHFYVEHSDIEHAYIVSESPSIPEKYTYFNNCDFNYINGHNLSGPNANRSQFRACIFDGNANFTNTSTGTMAKVIKSGCIIFRGSTTPCTPNEFSVATNIAWYHNPNTLDAMSNPVCYSPPPPNIFYAGTTDAPYVTLNFKQGTSFRTEEAECPTISTSLKIEEHGKIIFNGELALKNTAIENKGQLIVANTAAINCPTSASTYSSTAANSVFYVGHTSAVSGIPLVISTGGANCVIGNHAAFSTNACNPNYNEVSNTNALTLYYNSNIDCNSEFHYKLVGGTTPITYQLTNSSGTIPITTNPIIGLATGSYTMSATDATGCSISTEMLLTNPFLHFCCNADYTAAPSGTKQLIDGTSNYLASNISPSYLNGSVLFIHGNLIIDQSTNFTNCTFLFTPNAKITVQANTTLTFNGCTLKAGCNAMWDGIYASDPSAEIVIENGSTLQDMEHGVVVSGEAKLNSTNSNYYDNYVSIHLKNLPVTYSGIIEHCSFEKVSGLIAPWVAIEKPKHGIVVENCQLVTIGNPNSTIDINTFDKLWNGIYLNYTSQVINTNPAQIFCYYNQFLNIDGGIGFDPPVLPNDDNMFINPNGTAIFGNNSFKSYKVLAKIIGNDATSTISNFNHCHKAIILNSFNANVVRNNTQFTDGGFLFNQSEGKHIECIYNKLDGVRLGISKTGNEQHFHSDNNTITLAENFYATGITSVYYNTNNMGRTQIHGNTIEMPNTDYAIGIQLMNGSDDDMQYNEINFTNNSTTQALSTVPTLIGMKLVSNKNVWLKTNTIEGLTGTNFTNNRRATAFYTHKNLQSLIECNIARNLQFGMYVVGDNKTGDPKRVNNNLFDTYRSCLLFRHLSNEGTLGDIGEDDPNPPFYKYDGNNRFFNDMNTPPFLALYRFTTGTGTIPLDKVSTQQTNLDATSINFLSGSNLPGYRYDIQNPLNFNDIYLCTPPNVNALLCDGTIPNAHLHDMEMAIGIAEGSNQYSEYTEGGRWLDEQMLYEWLSRDTSIRYSSPILDSFYLANASGDLEKLFMIDELIGQLTDSTNMDNETYWNGLLNAALTENNNLSSTEVFTNNEKWVNALYLNYLAYGISSIYGEAFETLETLAHACPYIDGNAVFKARNIFAMFVPGIDYDDMQICNSIGVFKGGKSLYELENEGLDNTIETNNNGNNDLLIVYPNPASTRLTIELTLKDGETALFSIYDLLGNIVQVENLINNTTEISLHDITRGFYTYRCSIQGRNLYTGKLIVD